MHLEVLHEEACREVLKKCLYSQKALLVLSVNCYQNKFFDYKKHFNISKFIARLHSFQYNIMAEFPGGIGLNFIPFDIYSYMIVELS